MPVDAEHTVSFGAPCHIPKAEGPYMYARRMGSMVYPTSPRVHNGAVSVKNRLTHLLHFSAGMFFSFGIHFGCVQATKKECTPVHKPRNGGSNIDKYEEY